MPTPQYIQNPPNVISMQSYRSAFERFGGPAKMCRFAVRIMPVKNNQLYTKIGENYASVLNDLILLCESVEFPGRGFDFVDARYYGPNIQMPTNSKYAQQADLVFVCRTQSFERKLFDDWMEIVNPINTFDFNYLDQYESEIQIFQLSEYGDTRDNNPSVPSGQGQVDSVYQWTLLRAYPIQVHPQPVTWADQDILKLAVTFNYRYWFRPNMDDVGTQSRISNISPA